MIHYLIIFNGNISHVVGKRGRILGVVILSLRNFFLSVSFIVSVKVRIFPLSMRDIIIYIAR